MRVFPVLLVGFAVVAFGGQRSRPLGPGAGERRAAPSASVRTDGAPDGDGDQGDETSGDGDQGDETSGDETSGHEAARDDVGAGDPDNEDVTLAEPDVGDDGQGVELAHGDAGTRKRRLPRGGCPGSMVRVREYCIDRFEAPNRRGAKPLVMQSANDGAEWCNHHNKRLCTEDEWIGACEGEAKLAYPYGTTHADGVCNDDKPWRTVEEATLAKWPAPEARAHARTLYQATPSGWKHRCVSESGASDMTGNVEEWVARTREHANAWPYILVGCYWSGCYGGGKPTCHSTNDAHGPQFRFYETGFRCCRDAARAK